MRVVTLFAAMLVLPGLAMAKGPTTRIEIGHGKRTIAVLTGASSAGLFTIWSGPGTTMTGANGTTTMSTGKADFADWAAGPVEAPQGLPVYSVRFYCAAAAPVHEAVPSHLCYGVRYAVGAGDRGYIQIPAALDREFPRNMETIARGVEGSWYRASPRWDETIRPRLDAAFDAGQRDAAGRSSYEQPHIQRPSSPSTRAVSAKPTAAPKH
jgi:hypothetical protein